MRGKVRNVSALPVESEGLKCERIDGMTRIVIGIKCMFTNLRSILNNNKREELSLLILKEGLDVVGIAESWTHSDIMGAELNIPGFTMFRKDREVDGKIRGGGVLLYIRDYLEPQSDLVGDEGELVWGKIHAR